MSEHKFRYLLPPGNNFAFVAKFRIWLIISVLLMAGSLAALFINKSVRGEYMNWTIDFKGGTEAIYDFKKHGTEEYVKVDPAKIREVLTKSGEEGFDVSEISWDETVKGKADKVHVDGMIVRVPEFSALTPEQAEQVRQAFFAEFGKPGTDEKRKISKATWSGDRLNVRSREKISVDEVKKVFEDPRFKLDVRPWSKKGNPSEEVLYTTVDQASHEYSQWYSIGGIAQQLANKFKEVLPNTDVEIYQSYGVGSKAGAKLRDDAAKSIVYAIFLIMLYLAFRFDIRYAPGAAFATVHDAIMVIGVFAITWTDVSLVSVAGLLTVMGYSVNDTVIVFDRIRENQAKLKDKKIERIVDISINEMLVRTILTSSTVFATTLIMNIFGTGDVKNFAFAMNIGVIVGTYSSIFLATPIFMWVSKKWYSGPAPAKRRPSPVQPTPDS